MEGGVNPRAPGVPGTGTELPVNPFSLKEILALAAICRADSSGSILELDFTDFDLEVDTKISLSCRDLARKIMEPNGIKIVF